jgi:hypothetical protein
MTLIETIEVGNGGATSINFTSVPQSYTDLVLIISAREKNISDVRQPIFLTFNNNTSGYSDRILLGDGSVSSTTSNSYGAGSFVMAGYATSVTASANTFASTRVYIPGYTSSKQKTFSTDSVTENNSSFSIQSIQAQIWANTSAITSIQLTTYTAFSQYTTASIYGIAPQTLNNKPKATGGTINYSNGYWYHTFIGSGSFSPINGQLRCEVLVVAGGAGGSGTAAGAGGAGGVIKYDLNINSTHAVLVGAGGPNTHSAYNQGINSMLIGPDTAELAPAYGGGAGGYRASGYFNGASGGSGGGGASAAGTYGSGGSGVSGQGNSGGSGAGSGYAGGAGGGAGGTGGNADGTNGGTGGIGTSLYSAWGLATSTGHNVSGTVYYAGGGGGGGNGYASSSPSGAGSGPGGYGGGGAGGNGTSYSNAGTVLDGKPGTANTGGGGGGGAQEQGAGRDGIGGAGGSGIVIIRYSAD